MYEVKLINSDEEIIINADSTSQDAPRVTGPVKQGINCFNSFTFTIYPNNPGYAKVYPYKSKITVYNTLTGKYEFIGRVLTPSASMDENGVACKEYVCECELAYLCDSQQRHGEYHNYTPKQYLEALIAVHNAGVEESKHFAVGNVTVTDPNNSIYRYSDYKSTWENIKEDLIKTLGGELQIRYEDGIRYLDYLASVGQTCNTKIKLGHNMKSASEKLDIDGLYTRIIPLGAKIKAADENGNEVDTDERLTIASVNNGMDYLDYQDGINQYGIIQGVVVWDDVTTASALKSKAQEYINSLTFTLSNEITAYDLSLLGLDIDSFEVGNYYPVENELLGINYTLRIVNKTINIDNPAESSLTFGTQIVDIKTYNALKRQETQKRLDAALKQIKEVKNSIGVIADQKVEAYDEVLNQTALFQKLVNGGYDGFYLDDGGRLFIKGTYVATGIIASSAMVAGSTTEPVSWINLNDETFSFASGKIASNGSDLSIEGSIHATEFEVDNNIRIVDGGTSQSGIVWVANTNEWWTEGKPFIWGDYADNTLDLGAGNGHLAFNNNAVELSYNSGDDKYIKVSGEQLFLRHGIASLMLANNHLYINGYQGATRTITISGVTFNIIEGIITGVS